MKRRGYSIDLDRETDTKAIETEARDLFGIVSLSATFLSAGAGYDGIREFTQNNPLEGTASIAGSVFIGAIAAGAGLLSWNAHRKAKEIEQAEAVSAATQPAPNA